MHYEIKSAGIVSGARGGQLTELSRRMAVLAPHLTEGVPLSIAASRAECRCERLDGGWHDTAPRGQWA